MAAPRRLRPPPARAPPAICRPRERCAGSAISASGNTGRSASRPTAYASTAAWLYFRSNSRRRCSGTGTSSIGPRQQHGARPRHHRRQDLRPARAGRHASAAGSAAEPARRSAAPRGPGGTAADASRQPGQSVSAPPCSTDGERHAAAQAERRGDELGAAETGRAKLALHRHRVVARRAMRRQQQVERRAPPDAPRCPGQAAAWVSPGTPNATVPSRSISCTRSISHDR